MIRDVAELREHGQVLRRVDELDVDVDTWRAGMRIRTFLAEPADPLADLGALPGVAGAAPPGTIVFAVRTDLLVDRAALAAADDALPVPHELLDRLNRPPADVVPLPERRAPSDSASAGQTNPGRADRG